MANTEERLQELDQRLRQGDFEALRGFLAREFYGYEPAGGEPGAADRIADLAKRAQDCASRPHGGARRRRGRCRRPPRYPVAPPDFLLKLVLTGEAGDKPCAHLDQIQVTEPATTVCQECVDLGDLWLALRCVSSAATSVAVTRRSTGTWPLTTRRRAIQSSARSTGPRDGSGATTTMPSSRSPDSIGIARAEASPLAYMVYQRYTTAVKTAYRGRADVDAQHDRATEFRKWLEALEIEASVRAGDLRRIGW